MIVGVAGCFRVVECGGAERVALLDGEVAVGGRDVAPRYAAPVLSHALVAAVTHRRQILVEGSAAAQTVRIRVKLPIHRGDGVADAMNPVAIVAVEAWAGGRPADFEA